jgi:hypothetical protein
MLRDENQSLRKLVKEMYDAHERFYWPTSREMARWRAECMKLGIEVNI